MNSNLRLVLKHRCGKIAFPRIRQKRYDKHSAKDADGNVAPAENMLYDTKGCIVKVPAGKLAVIEGLEDYIVVDSGDELMICPKSGEQNIKKFIDDVKFKIGDRFI